MKFEAGLSHVIEFSFSEKDQQTFASLSGDFNPIHLDPQYAKSKGFPGSVVYGGLIISKISQLIGMQFPGQDGLWASLKIAFRNPLYVDRPAYLVGVIDQVSEGVGGLVLRIEVKDQDRVICTGTAIAALFNLPRDE